MNCVEIITFRWTVGRISDVTFCTVLAAAHAHDDLAYNVRCNESKLYCVVRPVFSIISGVKRRSKCSAAPWQIVGPIFHFAYSRGSLTRRLYASTVGRPSCLLMCPGAVAVFT